ncbi:NADPH-dependent FMN reductase [Flexithrix dorotheae]|uniref:NADPH-dependent FMN reductase n=1 Tax=Flexithrix dorotheae TaxID=70993 RepID=UPI000373A32E|nr:NAD(P)H-dependent oxidoreductase [Flexithrix dorotheae]
MTKKILAFAASNSKQSINQKLVAFTANQVDEAEITFLDLNDYEMPIYSIDREKESGIPELAQKFKALIKASDGIIISFAEHNGVYSAAFKNIFDWISRLGKDVWESKPMLLMATSPGGRGGKTVLDIALNRFQLANKNTIATFSLPFFNDNFSEENGITDEPLLEEFKLKLGTFENAVLPLEKVGK